MHLITIQINKTIIIQQPFKDSKIKVRYLSNMDNNNNLMLNNMDNLINNNNL